MAKTETTPDSPFRNTPIGRLATGFATLAHGHENTAIIAALLQFTSSLLVTQIYRPHLGRMVDKYCADLTEMVADKEAKTRAADPSPVANGKAKSQKARPLRRKKSARA